MKKFLIPAAIAGSLFLGAGEAQAAFGPTPLDTFNTGEELIQINGPVPKPSVTETVTGSGIVGGERTSTFELLAGTDSSKASKLVIASPGSNALSVNNDTGFNSTASIDYSNVASADPIQGSFFYFEITDFDKAFNGDVEIAMTVNGVTSTKPVSVSVAPSDLQSVSLEFPFAEFGLGSGLNDITDLSFSVTGTVTSYDIEIDNFGYIAVPAPAIVPGTILAGALLTRFKSLANKTKECLINR